MKVCQLKYKGNYNTTYKSNDAVANNQVTDTHHISRYNKEGEQVSNLGNPEHNMLRQFHLLHSRMIGNSATEILGKVVLKHPGKVS